MNNHCFVCYRSVALLVATSIFNLLHRYNRLGGILLNGLPGNDESIPYRREPYRRVPLGRVRLDERLLDEDPIDELNSSDSLLLGIMYVKDINMHLINTVSCCVSVFFFGREINFLGSE